MKPTAKINRQEAETATQSLAAGNEPSRLAPEPTLTVPPAKPDSAPPVPTSIELHIEELVLHGVALENHAQLAAAVERELTQLLSERGIQPSLSGDLEIERLHGGAFRTRQGESATSLSHHLAGAIYRSITGGTRK